LKGNLLKYDFLKIEENSKWFIKKLYVNASGLAKIKIYKICSAGREKETFSSFMMHR
jgi:hypothetical protein